jgi:hypothetical protein
VVEDKTSGCRGMPTTSGGQPPGPAGTDQADPVTSPTFMDEALVMSIEAPDEARSEAIVAGRCHSPPGPVALYPVAR